MLIAKIRRHNNFPLKFNLLDTFNHLPSGPKGFLLTGPQILLDIKWQFNPTPSTPTHTPGPSKPVEICIVKFHHKFFAMQYFGAFLCCQNITAIIFLQYFNCFAICVYLNLACLNNRHFVTSVAKITHQIWTVYMFISIYVHLFRI